MGTFGYGSIFRFWFPLAVTWLLMACEGPWPGILPGALALVVGRLLGIVYLRRHCRVAIRSLQGEV